MPFGTLFALFFLWFGISTPLVFVGSYFGYKKPPPEDPVRTNKIPRQIPDQVLHLRLFRAVPKVSCLLATPGFRSRRRRHASPWPVRVLPPKPLPKRRLLAWKSECKSGSFHPSLCASGYCVHGSLIAT